MRLLSRLDDERKSGAIWYVIFRQSPKGTKPPERQGNVLFINADAEYRAGRAQNYLEPEHIEKIVSAYRRFTDMPGFAAVVSHAELADNDYNLKIRRYADNAPPPVHTAPGRYGC